MEIPVPGSDISAEANTKGWIQVAYRIALEGKRRDARLLTSRDGGDTFKTKRIAPWFRGRVSSTQTCTGIPASCAA